MSNKYYLNSFFWSTLSTLSVAIVNFIAVPILLQYFGIKQYGILTLAIATNAYVSILNIGNTGAVKFFSEWINNEKKDLIKRVSGTSISFYGAFGIINSIILIVIALFGENWFHLTHEEFSTYKISLYILAIFSIINWSTYVFTQLLIANEKIATTHKVNTLVAIGNLFIVFFTKWCNLSLNEYFFLHTALQSIIIIPYYIVLRKDGIIDSFKPQFFWKDFSVIFKYSIAIFTMGIFQAMAQKSRPLILGLASTDSATILGEYRIIEVFPTFIISLCGALISIFLPKSSKMVAANDNTAINNMAYNGTRITSILTCCICFPIILNSSEIITVYVGGQYAYLSTWMVIWIATLVLNLYNSPIASLILASGKTKMLVYSSALACIISMAINAILCPKYGVGSAVIGYLVYIIIQQLFYYFYFNNKVMGLDSFKVLLTFAIPTIIAITLYFIIELIPYNWAEKSRLHIIIYGCIKGGVWLLLYIGILLATHVLKKQDILSFTNK